MKNPLISVIVPLYNYENYIGWCIQSIVAQPYPNLEIIVVDDCSTDNSFDIASEFSQQYSNVQLMRLNENSGYSKAKNEGIIASKGEYITCLDADDMFTDDSIYPRLNALASQGASFVHARAITVKGDLSLEDCKELKKTLRGSAVIHAQTVMIKRDVYQKFGLYDENLKSRSDKEMWWRLFGQGLAFQRVKRTYIPVDVAYYRRHSKSMMARRKRNPKLQKRVTRWLYTAYKMRCKEGITKENTRFLDK